MVEFTLNDGTRVLARVYNGRPEPVTYVNATQAAKASAKYGLAVYHRPDGRCWYLEMQP